MCTSSAWPPGQHITEPLSLKALMNDFFVTCPGERQPVNTKRGRCRGHNCHLMAAMTGVKVQEQLLVRPERRLVNKQALACRKPAQLQKSRMSGTKNTTDATRATGWMPGSSCRNVGSIGRYPMPTQQDHVRSRTR